MKEVKDMQQSMLAKNIVAATRQMITSQYSSSARRLIFLDYDGTLVGFKTNIEAAAPDQELYSILEQLTSNPRNEVVIVSGRDHNFLEKWFGTLPLNIIAEHGAWVKYLNQDWVVISGLSSQWKKDLMPVLEMFSDRTPGAFIEEKDYSLVWHYRKVEADLGELRTNELVSTLRYLAEDKGLQLLPGNKVVEVKNIEINKGKAAITFLSRGKYDFIMALGDDHTDEDIFKALPETAVTVKVGSHITAARFYLRSYVDVRSFLQELGQTIASEAGNEVREKQKLSFLQRLSKIISK